MVQNHPSDQSIAQPLGKILVGYLLFRGETRLPAQIQRFVNNLKENLGGDDAAREFLKMTESSHIHLVEMIAEKTLLGKVLDETIKKGKELDKTELVLIEFGFMNLTGQNEINRWDPTLWKIKSRAEEYIKLSPSKVTKEDLLVSIKPILKEIVLSLREYALKQI